MTNLERINGHKGTLLSIAGAALLALGTWAWYSIDKRLDNLDIRLRAIEKLAAERGEAIPRMKQDIRDLQELIKPK